MTSTTPTSRGSVEVPKNDGAGGEGPRGEPQAIVLAAGKGTRMKSDLPKVCHPIGGRPMVCAVVDTCLAAGCKRVVVVVGYKQELVREALADYGDRVEYAVQDEQLGTGHAVMCASELFTSVPAATPVLVLCGDGPLIRTETLMTMLETHATEVVGSVGGGGVGSNTPTASTTPAATLATSVIEDPTGYGRIVRDSDGVFVGIVEQKNATPEQLAIREVNPSYYCVSCGALFEALARVQRNELTGEYYVTDVPALLLASGRVVSVIDAVPAEDVLSINTLDQLAEVDRIFRARASDHGRRTQEVSA